MISTQKKVIDKLANKDQLRIIDVAIEGSPGQPPVREWKCLFTNGDRVEHDIVARLLTAGLIKRQFYTQSCEELVLVR